MICFVSGHAMPRNYKRPIGARKYKDYTDETLVKAVEEVKKGVSLRKAAEQFGISRCALTAAVKGNTKKVGRPFILSTDDQQILAECIGMSAEWGFPLTILDIRLIVKGYLDRNGRTEPRFKDNMPGVDFVTSFIHRHSEVLSNRMCQNIKRSRAAVSTDIINDYFNELSVSLKDVDPSMIVNYDETNMTDDPGRKKVVVRRGSRHPERIIDSSKSSTSVMFAGSADGHILPPCITYKASNLYDTWTENGPTGAVYNRSKSGWFTLEIFEDWFCKIALPYFRKFNADATKVLIGDNLSSHISAYIIEKCKEYNIKFILLPPNSTHYTQPLDVAFFRPLKIKWRQTLNEWKEKNRGSIPKDKFPRLLKKCIADMGEENIKKNLKSGFKGAGIVPLDRQQVLKRLPGGKAQNNCENDADSSTKWVDSFKSYLDESRRKETEPLRKIKKRKLNVPAGRGIEGLESVEAERQEEVQNDLQEPRTSKNRRRNYFSDSSEDSDVEVSIRDSDSDLVLSDFTDVDFEEKEESLTEKNPVPKKTSLQMEDIKPGMFVIAELLFNKNTKKEVKKQFYALVQDSKLEEKTITVKFFRKSTKSVKNDYVFPYVDDVLDISVSDIITIVIPTKITRGHHSFPFILKD